MQAVLDEEAARAGETPAAALDGQGPGADDSPAQPAAHTALFQPSTLPDDLSLLTKTQVWGSLMPSHNPSVSLKCGTGSTFLPRLEGA